MRDTFCKKKYNVGDIIKFNGSDIIVIIERIDNDGYYRSGIWCFSDLDVQWKEQTEIKKRENKTCG